MSYVNILLKINVKSLYVTKYGDQIYLITGVRNSVQNARREN